MIIPVLGKRNLHFLLFIFRESIDRWGNTQVNTTTKPLFEETLNIVLECFDKYKHNRPLLPISCLNNYQLIYNENQDNENLLRDDNQVFSERVSTRYSVRDSPSRSSNSSRTLPRINTSRTSTTTDTSTSTEVMLPVVVETTNLTKTIDTIEPREPIIKPVEQETEKQRLLRLKTIRAKYTFRFPVRTVDPITASLGIQRSFSSAYAFNTIQRRKRVDLKPIYSTRKRNKQQLLATKSLTENSTDSEKKENTMIIEEDEQEQQNQLEVPSMIIEQTVKGDTSTVCPVY